MFRMHRLFAVLLAVVVAWVAPSAFATQVTPSERVTGHVNVREFPATQDSAVVGQLAVGQAAELLEVIPYWYRVRLGDGTEGYVSKAWTRLVEDPTTAALPFALHVVDVGVGDAIIVDIGDREIVIDGGNFPATLHDYLADTGVIDGPIELGIVTHADFDHWKGLVRALDLDGKATVAQRLLEFWEPGYDRSCSPLASYDAFLAGVHTMVGDNAFRRPLAATHVPAAHSGQVQPFTHPRFPGVTFTLLHSDAQPDGPDCAYRINNASIVLLLEINGVRVLLTGDANGKARDESGPGTPAHVEAKLLAIEHQHPGTLKADILKVPHHGSETASTQEFIDAVDPSFVLISASTNHHLPRPTVLQRYEKSGRVVLRTDANRAKNTDHIYCASSQHGQVDCNYRDQFIP